ncbi:unnamed protein product [Effrenium voratum]|uniref:SbsA Ig-like domain-containing protein n=1 Tax=Effrenium voratum TaxID=2562239 RepID=A0AA36NDR2_9DINO|nr:unnamed protein product [Effrenium voratum]
MPLGFTDYYRAISVHDTVQVSFDSLNTTMTISPNDPLLGSTVAQSNLCRINAVSLNDCKGQIWDITISDGVLRRVVATSLLAQVDLLYPLQPAGSLGETYRVRTKAADVTPPVMTMVSAHGISESTVRVTLRLDESGTSFCQAFADGGSGQKLAVTLSEIGASFSGIAVLSSTLGYAEMEVDVSGLSAKTYYSVFCYAQDTEQPIVNVVTMGAAVATRQRVRTLDTTAPTTLNCSAEAAPGKEDAIDVSVILGEPGTAFCAVVRSGLPVPSRFMVVAAGFQSNTSFYEPYEAAILVNMASAGYGPTGLASLSRGTGYDVFCWAQDDEGTGQDAAIQCGPQGLPGAVRTLDLTPPQMYITDAEAIAKDTLRVTLRVDEGSKIWCAAWTEEPDGISVDFEVLIKSKSANCTDSFGNECGSFWVYDLDDLEDSTDDGVFTQADFDSSNWKYHQDVSILLTNLQEATEYSHIYCFAQDDEDDGLGNQPNKMTFNTSAATSQVSLIRDAIGSVTTLDETPPTFTLLEIQDPTALNDRIQVTFTLNEPGTGYCRAIRADSGEDADMLVNRILSANWEAIYDGNGTQTITMTKLDNVTPSLTNRDDQDIYFQEATLYNIYCWAKDSAVDTKGYARPNFMEQDYVFAEVVSSGSPSGGRTSNVWVRDTTPPQMIFVDAESLEASAIQVTLQLNEPGTVWCQILSLDSNASICDVRSLQENATASCYYADYIKGSGAAVFSSNVPAAYRNVHIKLDRWLESDLVTSTPLTRETQYQVLCFAEDDWDVEALSLPALQRSPQFQAPGSPNKVSLAAVYTLRQAIGTKTTLDETPPAFTQLQIEDPTMANDHIVISFALNEPGTAYCRATRSDSGETAADMQIVRIMSAAWAGEHNGSATPSTITMLKLENNDLSNGNAGLVEAQQYDVYCMAQDDATDDGGLPRPNLMAPSYIAADVLQPLSPQGGRTAGVWVADTSPPTMSFVRAEAIGQETLQVTLQLDEPGTIWCQAADLATVLDLSHCRQSDIQETFPNASCFFEDFVKGDNDTLFYSPVHEAFRDVSIDISRIRTRNASSSIPLAHETSYNIFCFAEDDWPAQVASASNSVNIIFPTTPNKVDLAAGLALQSEIGNLTTLDKAAPTFTLLQIKDPTAANDRIIVTFALNEPGVAYCRATRSDSGEQGPDMHINRILSAAWSSSFSQGNATIEMTQLENRSLDILDNAQLVEATQYDIYCWAEDDAVDGVGYAAPNYMTQDYATQGVGSVTNPSGGATFGVWLRDLTPPTMVFVRSEAVARESPTLQVTLQLSEPGTVWCQAAEPSSLSPDHCSTWEVAETVPGNPCYFESFIKGNASDGSEFAAHVAEAYRNVQVEVSALQLKGAGSQPLETEHAYNIFCFAEDDWVSQADGSATHSISFVSPAAPLKTSLNDTVALKDTVGLVVTLDETPPTFTKLLIPDPTEHNDRINITLSLNEPGTAYCRATRSDSGESAADMTINRIIAAGWSAAYSGSDVTIEMTKIENIDPSQTARDDVDVYFEEQTQYDVYCWAQDSAVDSNGLARPNYMSHEYVSAEVNSSSSPSGGSTLNIWVVDSTPPTMTFVRADALASATLQVTLQLNEPGTVWCQAVEVSASTDIANCKEQDMQDALPAGDCFFETFVTGTGPLSPPDAVFQAQVHEAFRNVDLDINRIVNKGASSSSPLLSEYPYTIFCFAQDDWKIQADASAYLPNYLSPSGPNKVNLTDAQQLQSAIGVLYTLDEAPPSFTSLAVTDPTATNDRIVVTFSLNEAGTAYCRPTRHDSGETEQDLTINRILSAGWSAVYDGNVTEQNLEIWAIENAPADLMDPLVEAQQYDLYCWAKDSAVDFGGYARPNYMLHSYATTLVGSGPSPAGGKIEGIWITDSTPPSIFFVRAAGVKTEDTLQITLQLSEPGTVWCQASEPINRSGTTYCREDEIHESDPSSACYWETFVKGSTVQGTSFSALVHEAFTYVQVEVNRIWRKTMTAGDPLLPETDYKIFCFAEDDWPSQAQTNSNSVYFNSSSLMPQTTNLAAGNAFKEAVGLQTTLDLSPPSISVSNPASLEHQITVSVNLSEAGTAWCRPVRQDFAMPSLLEILAANFIAEMLVEPFMATVTMTGEDATVPLVRGTNYQVYCYAEDDLCDGCHSPSGIDSASIAATRTDIRTLDTTPPGLRVVDVRSIAKDTIQVSIQADEGVRLWCAAWPSGESPVNETDFESTIKSAASSSCTDSWGRACGSFWIYDSDDVEDTSLDGLSSLTEYRHFQTWRKDEDVTIMLGGLIEATEYHVYCFAEDDEPDGQGSEPNKMSFATGPASTVASIQAALGNVTTLDETPPEFTQLAIQDPTAFNDRIQVTFALNEPGTAFCRATRSDSGETGQDMYIGWIQTAGWSAEHDGSSVTSSINITKLENLNPLETNRDDSDVPIQEAQQYDVYCWAMDNAVDTAGMPRPNFMPQRYVLAEVNSTISPTGGYTKGVWVVDTSPPGMIFVTSEATSSTSLQVTLQLDEPGTVWCQPGDLSGLATHCQTSDVQNVSASDDCYWLNFIQGNGFRADAHEAFVDVSINMNLLYPIGANAAVPLTAESEYEIFCYAEDDWVTQANSAAASVNFVPVTTPNSVSFAAANDMRSSIGIQTTLDASPPIFTKLAVQDPTAESDRISVTFSLNEPGTVYCRATRSDSGESGSDMTINRIVSAGWSAAHNGSAEPSNLTMTSMERALGSIQNFDEGTQYDVYCAAKDSAVDSRGLARPNWMPWSYVQTAVGSPDSPAGGFTTSVWVVDTTPPSLILVDAFATSSSSLQIRLQLDEPGTVWCAPLTVDNATFCTLDDMSDITGSLCHFELFVKGQQHLQASSFVEVSEPHRNVDMKVNRISTRDETDNYELESEHRYRIFCFAEDDWPLQAAAATNSPNFVAPVDPLKISFADALAFANLIGSLYTLDESPPIFTSLHVQDPTMANDRIAVTFSLNEPGTAYCRATRSDSGETSLDMTINRILTANWMAQNDGVNSSTIVITQLENVDPLLTNRDDEVDLISEATQYDVYCWAQDAAVDTYGYPRSNYMTIDYVRADVHLADAPQGGRSPGVWVTDTTPPTMIFVRAEGISGDTVQVTLQLDEPGTVWCAAVTTDSDPTYCLHGEMPAGSFSTGGSCPYETMVKGEALNTSFVAEVHQAHTSVQVDVNKILRKDLFAADSLIPETSYYVYCFAEDDWPANAAGALVHSQSYGPDPQQPNKVSLEDVLNFSNMEMLPTTLDVAPPSFTILEIQDPTSLNSRIEVTFALNEAGTAYCRPVRRDSAEAAAPLEINHIISAGWSGIHNPQLAANGTITINGVQQSPLQELDEAKQYDVYCWAKDEAKNNFGYARPQYMSQQYVGTDIGNTTAPVGGKTSQVWVVDTTAPTMLFVAWDALDEHTLQVTLQLSEPGTVWCQAASNSCQLQDADPSADCYFESYIKNATTEFRKEVHQAFRDVEVEVNKIPLLGDAAAWEELAPKTGYNILCFTQDDWTQEAASGSPNFVAPHMDNKVSLSEVLAFKDVIGIATTLDLTPPNLTIHGATASEELIALSFSLDEAGTVWCRALRKGAVVPHAAEILETGFYAEAGADVAGQVNITAESPHGNGLARGTDYEVYCYAQDVLCLGCTAPSGSTAQAILESRTFIRTADATPPRIRVFFAEATSRSTIQLTLQIDEGAKVWCAAWEAEPTGFATNFEGLIKAESANCTESHPPQRECGTFWVYDLDDLEDTPLDGVATAADYTIAYQFSKDVQITLSGLKENTTYGYIYCFAEDDEVDGMGSLPNKMYYDSTSAPAGLSSDSLLVTVKDAVGPVTTLDESPPVFTELSFLDPADGVITATFALNEPGTAYCRATRSDSGETAEDMHINRILAAGWSAVYSDSPATISMTHIRSSAPLDSPHVPILGSTQYDVYCWAKDNAVSTLGFERPNYMMQEYVSTAVGVPSLPMGGATAGVWVADVIPPTIIFVASEAVSSNTIQVTLQLDEPGTIWCAAAETDSSADINCRESDMQDSQADQDCYYETHVKGTDLAMVHTAFRDVDIEISRIWARNRTSSSSLLPETTYYIFCFAEDDWVLQSAGASVSPNFVAPSRPNKSPFPQIQALVAEIGARTTLDEAPPSFTKLAIQNPTAANDRIVITFALNEPGTAYCRARRVDAGTSSMKIPDILAAGWWASFSGTEETIVMTQISRPDPAIGALDSETMAFDEQYQYDVFCWAHDHALDGRGFSRRNGQTEFYVNTDVGQEQLANGTLPGSKTSGVWIVDSTPPDLMLVQAEALGGATLQVRLQLDEPGTVWCAATDVDSGASSFCRAGDLQGASPAFPCYFEDYIKGNQSGAAFEVHVPEAFADVDVEINRIVYRDMSASSSLLGETPYQIFCFAEDDWKIQADSANNSAGYVSPAGPQGTTWLSVQGFSSSIGSLTTLDEASPIFTNLQIQDPTASEGVLSITLALNEVGTAYCRATRSDSGETASDMPLNRVLTANWYAVYDGSNNVTINMNNLENVDPLLTNRDDEVAPLAAGTQYDVFCWAQDSAVTTAGYARPNFMPAVYVATPVTSPTSPTGGYTKGVWMGDTTPPQMFFTSFDALSEDAVLITLQLSEPGTVWCAATVPNDGSAAYCRPSDLQDTDTSAQCYYEDYIKGSTAQGTTFVAEVPSGFVDVYVEVNRIALAAVGGSGAGAALPAETQFMMLCFAQDNWDLRSQAAYSSGQGSPNFVAPQPNKVTLAQVQEFLAAAAAAGASATTLDLTAPTVTARTLHAPPASESSLEVVYTVDEASTLYCLALASGEDTPHVSTVFAEGQSQNCSAAAFVSGICSGLTLELPGLLRGASYEVHCSVEDDNIYPLVPNRNNLPLLTAQVNDFTPPQLTVVRSSAAEPGTITVTLQMDEPGTVWCFSPSTIGQTLVPSWVLTHGYTTETVISEASLNTDFEVVVALRGTSELPLITETPYETYCAARDTATNPSCTDPACPAVPNLNTLVEMQTVRDAIGQVITRDVDPPTFAILGARGVSENQLVVTLQLNEPGTSYCRATRTDSGSTRMHVSHIVQAGYSAGSDAVGTSIIEIDKLANRADEDVLIKGTAYNIYCWAKDNAQIHSCRPVGGAAACSFEDAPNYMVQSYVETRFSQLVHSPDLADASGGLVDMVRTWDSTPPVLAVIDAESRTEDSITVTLQLDEPGTAYCRAFQSTVDNATFADVMSAPGGPFSFDLPSDSALRSFSASAYRNFEITVSGLSREVLYYVYCTAEDDELLDGCFQRNATESPSCDNNQADAVLTETAGRYTLDLTPPSITVTDAVSYTQDSVTVTVLMSEAGTVWCSAVLDLQPPPSTNEVVAAGFVAHALNAGIVSVVVQGLIRDTEYDMYCFAQDDGTMSAANSSLEVRLSKKNAIGYTEMVATKMDAHVIYDSTPPQLLSTDPVHNAPVVSLVNITLTFDEDIQAGNGTVELRATGETVSIAATDLIIWNAAATITGSLHGGLTTGKTWRIVVLAGAIQDISGNPFEGIADGSYTLQA